MGAVGEGSFGSLNKVAVEAVATCSSLVVGRRNLQCAGRDHVPRGSAGLHEGGSM